MASISRLLLVFGLILASSLAGCSSPGAAPSSSLASQAVLTEPPPTTRTPPPPSPTPQEPQVLRLWVPPQFDPASKAPAGRLFKARLDEFQELNPGVVIETRLKAVDGPGGLLDSLTTASAAAPQALPDLVALPRDLLETAALKGLLLPLDDLTDALDEPDWYPYATELASLGSDVYGFPFAGDALAQAYRPALTPDPLTDFQDALGSSAPVIFPAAGDQSDFTLALYQAEGGEPVDDQGRPYLDPRLLTQVLSFYTSAEATGVMSPTLLTQLQTEEQVWDAFMGQRVGSAILWSSTFLQNQSGNLGLAPIPTHRGAPFTLATGWVWALAGRDQSKRELSVELAEFLTDSQFLAEWTPAAGYLPSRPSASSQWPKQQMRPIIDQIALSARLFPPKDILSSLDNPLQQAVLSVLKKESTPLSAAEDAAASLTGP